VTFKVLRICCENLKSSVLDPNYMRPVTVPEFRRKTPPEERKVFNSERLKSRMINNHVRRDVLTPKIDNDQNLVLLLRRRRRRRKALI